jgi:hypothetical protein
VTKAASGDELFGSFAEAAFVTALRLFTGLDIQEHREHRGKFVGGVPSPRKALRRMTAVKYHWPASFSVTH